MSILSTMTVVQPNPDGSVPIPQAADEQANTVAAALEREVQMEALQSQMQALQDILAKPLKEILAEYEQLKKNALGWEAHAAMWILGQRAMRRVAMDLAAQQGVSEEDVVSRALEYANKVLNSDGEDLEGTLAPSQLAHIGRHKAFLRTQYK